MATEKKTALKNFNRDLLTEELSASPLPFLKAHPYGFDRINRYEGAPRTEDRIVSRVRQPDGSYVEDRAAPGEIRFEFSSALRAAQDTQLDNLIAAHDSTQRTAEQNREGRDEADMDWLIANYPNVDTLNNAQLCRFVKRLARVVIRERRTPPV